MAEKKEKPLSKTALKKLENEKRHDFIFKAYRLVLESIADCSEELRANIQIRLNHSNYNRYIAFHEYGKDLKIRIYQDGNVVVELAEAFHATFTQQIFSYEEECDRQDEFLKKFPVIIGMLIREFSDRGVLDYHSYMDYVSHEKEIMKAYELMMKDDAGEPA